MYNFISPYTHRTWRTEYNCTDQCTQAFAPLIVGDVNKHPPKSFTVTLDHDRIKKKFQPSVFLYRNSQFLYRNFNARIRWNIYVRSWKYSSTVISWLSGVLLHCLIGSIIPSPLAPHVTGQPYIQYLWAAGEDRIQDTKYTHTPLPVTQQKLLLLCEGVGKKQWHLVWVACVSTQQSGKCLLHPL